MSEPFKTDPRWHSSGRVHFATDIDNQEVFVIVERGTKRIAGRFTGVNTWFTEKDADRYRKAMKDSDQMEVKRVRLIVIE